MIVDGDSHNNGDSNNNVLFDGLKQTKGTVHRTTGNLRSGSRAARCPKIKRCGVGAPFFFDSVLP